MMASPQKLRDWLKTQPPISLSFAEPAHAIAGVQIPAVGQVAVAAVLSPTLCPANGRQTDAFLLSAAEAAFAALRDAEPDPIAEAERAAIQRDAVPHPQTTPQDRMVVGLLAGAGEPRRGAQAEVQTDTNGQPLHCFPCGALVLDGNRKWSATRGWCCSACVGDAA